MIENIERIIQNVEPGLKKYKSIMDKFHKVDVSIDKDFQREFNGFYRIRQRSKEFYSTYYSLLEKCKFEPMGFSEILETLHRELGRFEASFSSKLLATVDPSKPIWDVFVLENLNLKKPSPHSKKRFNDIVSLYNQIVQWYDDMITSEKGKRTIEIFDNKYPNSGISDIKKIDFILWQIRN